MTVFPIIDSARNCVKSHNNKDSIKTSSSFNPIFIGDKSYDNKCLERVSSFYFLENQSLIMFEVPYSTYQYFISLYEKKFNTVRTITFVVSSSEESSIGGIMSLMSYIKRQNTSIKMNLILPNNSSRYTILDIMNSRGYYNDNYPDGFCQWLNILSKNKNEIIPFGKYDVKTMIYDTDSNSCTEIRTISHNDMVIRNIYYNGKYGSIFQESGVFENISKLIIDVSNKNIRNVKKKELFDVLSQNYLLLANTIFTGFYDDIEKDFYLQTQQSILSKNELPDKYKINSER